MRPVGGIEKCVWGPLGVKIVRRLVHQPAQSSVIRCTLTHSRANAHGDFASIGRTCNAFTDCLSIALKPCSTVAVGRRVVLFALGKGLSLELLSPGSEQNQLFLFLVCVKCVGFYGFSGFLISSVGRVILVQRVFGDGNSAAVFPRLGYFVDQGPHSRVSWS